MTKAMSNDNVRDAHCHFFSAGFFRALGRERQAEDDGAIASPAGELGWEAPGDGRGLADRWVAELDRARRRAARC